MDIDNQVITALLRLKRRGCRCVSVCFYGSGDDGGYDPIVAEWEERAGAGPRYRRAVPARVPRRPPSCRV